jgi:glycosyltransferase involved in cell wall biosynthesis
MSAALAARGHEVDLFTTDQDGVGRLDVPTDVSVVKRGVRVRYFRSGIRRIWPLALPLCRALAREIPRYDVVHIHSLYLSHGVVAGHYCRKFGVPYIMQPHGSLDPFLRERHRLRKAVYELLIERRNMEHAAGIHFTAEEERRLALPYIGKSRSFVVPLGIYPEDYANLPPRGTFRREFPEVGGRRIVLHLGRINFKKGLDVLVDAFSLLAAKRGDVHLVLAGPDNEGYGVEIRKRIERHGLSDRVTFTGTLEGDIKLAALAEADVFALPSYTENFGISVVEAMACGLPVVISKNVNIWREVAAAAAGIATECTGDACGEALNRVLADPALAQQMGASGQQLAMTRFNWLSVGQQLEEVYLEIGMAARAKAGMKAATGQEQAE